MQPSSVIQTQFLRLQGVAGRPTLSGFGVLAA